MSDTESLFYQIFETALARIGKVFHSTTPLYLFIFYRLTPPFSLQPSTFVRPLRGYI